MNVGSTVTQSPVFMIGVFIVIFIVICAILFAMKKNSVVSNPTNIATTIETQRAIFMNDLSSEFKDKKNLLQAIQQESIAENENCLINFQPLTVIQPGFLGPAKDGVYDEKDGVSTVLRMGARCFVLPIDFHTKDTMPKGFPEANKPCLLFRDEGDTIRSINAGSIAKVAQSIADVAWSDMVTQKNDPFILILSFVRTPPENTKEYLDFLSQVAKELAPLSPYLLGQTPEGVYNRQARQDQLLFVNTNQLEKKLLIFCNVDTSGFRTSTKDFKKTYIPKEDLDYWVHLRIYKQNIQTSVGATSIAGEKQIPRSILEKTTYYTTLPSDATTKKKAIDGTKQSFFITLSPNGTNPTSDVAKTLLDTYGVQAVPLFLVDYSADTKTVLSNWKNAWKAKPKAIRYIRPAPQRAQQQSSSVNANGGSVNVPA